MAQQISDLTRTQILAQSNASAAVQANASPSLVLDLIEQHKSSTGSKAV